MAVNHQHLNVVVYFSFIYLLAKSDHSVPDLIVRLMVNQYGEENVSIADGKLSVMHGDSVASVNLSSLLDEGVDVGDIVTSDDADFGEKLTASIRKLVHANIKFP